MTAPESPQDPPVFTFFVEVGIIEQLGRTAFTRVLPKGMQISQFSMLHHLVRRGGGWTPARLANAFQVTKGAITNTLTRLEARGLVRLETDEKDKRSKRVFITEEGQAMRQACIEALTPLLEQLHAQLGNEVFLDVLPSLQKVRQFLDEARDEV